MKKTLILILIIFSIINCQSDDDKLNINDDKTLKTFNLKLDKNYFLVNKEIKVNINYELENKQDNKNLVLRLKSIGSDFTKHQINGPDFIFGKNDVKGKQEFFDNIDGHLYLIPKITGYLDLEFSGQLYDTVKKQYVGKPIISKISLVSLRIDLSLSYANSYPNINVKFDDGKFENDDFLSTESNVVEGFDLTIIVNDNEIETIKNINLYGNTRFFENKATNVPEKVDFILKQRLTNGDRNIFKFNDLEFDFKKIDLKKIKLKSFDLKLDKNYFLVNKKIKIKVNYEFENKEVENKEVNKNLVLRVRSIGENIIKHQINGVDFVFGKNDVKEKQEFFDNIKGYMYLVPKKAGNLSLVFSCQMYDTLKKEYVGNSIISKISFVCLKIEVMVLKSKKGYYSYDCIINAGEFRSDNFFSNNLVSLLSLKVMVNESIEMSGHFMKPYLKSIRYGLSSVFKETPRKIDLTLFRSFTDRKLNMSIFFENVEFKILK